MADRHSYDHAFPRNQLEEEEVRQSREAFRNKADRDVPQANNQPVFKHTQVYTPQDVALDFQAVQLGDFVVVKRLRTEGEPQYELHQVTGISQSKGILTAGMMRFKPDGFLFQTANRYTVRVLEATEEIRAFLGHKSRAAKLQAIKWEQEDLDTVLDVYLAYVRAKGE